MDFSAATYEYSVCIVHVYIILSLEYCTSESEFCSYTCCTIVCVAINQFTFVHS